MSAMPSTVWRPGTSTSSNSTPRRRSSATTDSRLSTSNAIWVWSPEARPGRLEHGEVAVAAAVAKTALACLDRFEAELLGVEGTGPPEVLRREARGHFSVLERRHACYDLPRRRSSSGPPGFYPDASTRPCSKAS